ncbi:hypothetical protein [Halobacillus salinus]|uniref:hypothetical protein n=1 Tax=Halobacillus salinus TaxID=192814 RepID=UPI001590139E|nr:hypothetical protein [Halobacillus salinus]
MCPICHGSGKHYDYTNSVIMVIPCPNEECRLAAQERSARTLKWLEEELDKVMEKSA